MAAIKEILSLMRSLAPESDTEPGFEDNVGLLLGSEQGAADKVMLCLDCTKNVVDEAVKAGAALIISHHPAIFRPISRITDGDPTGSMLLAAARAGISVYSAHTNLDFCPGGLNDYAAELMGLSEVRPMEMIGGIGVGRIGRSEEISLKDFAAALAAAFDDRHIRVIGTGREQLRKVAVVNGGGGDIGFVRRAAELGADCYVTADVPHHVALFAEQSGMPMIIMQHYSMEAVYISRLSALLKKEAEKRGVSADFIVSATEYNPAQQEVL